MILCFGLSRTLSLSLSLFKLLLEKKVMNFPKSQAWLVSFFQSFFSPLIGPISEWISMDDGDHFVSVQLNDKMWIFCKMFWFHLFLLLLPLLLSRGLGWDDWAGKKQRISSLFLTASFQFLFDYKKKNWWFSFCSFALLCF